MAGVKTLLYTHDNRNDINPMVHIQIQVTLLFQVQTHLLTSDFGFFDMRRETKCLKVFRNHTMLTLPTNVRHISWCPKNSTTSSMVKIKVSTQWQRTQLSASMVQYQLSTDSFSKSSNSQDHLFLA